MKINYAPRVEYPVLTNNGCHCVYVGNTFEDALDYVRDNWVEGEGFDVEIQAATRSATRLERITLCTITDNDPRDYIC